MDTFIGKVNGLLYPLLKSEGEEKEKLGTELVQVVEKEIEPLLEGAQPFFGGKESLTLAEVNRRVIQMLRLRTAERKDTDNCTGFDGAVRGSLPSLRSEGIVPKEFARRT